MGVGLQRLLTLTILFCVVLYGEYLVSEHYIKHSWLGYGFVDSNMNSFTKAELVKSIEQIDPPFMRVYIAYELVDCLFCLIYAIFFCDIITVFLYPATSDNSIIRWIDLFPFILALIDFLENLAMIIGLNYYPYGAPIALEIAVNLSNAKQIMAIVVAASVLLSIVTFIMWKCFSLLGAPKSTAKAKKE